MIELEPAVVSKKHIDFLYGCYCSEAVQGNFQPTKTISYERIAESLRLQDEMFKYVFIIVYNGLYVGYAYSYLSRAFNHFEIGVTVMPSMRRIGLGSFAHQVLIAWTLENHKTHRLTAYVSYDNTAERIILERLGFHLEGVMRQAGIIREALHDIAVYGALRSELALMCKT